MLVSRNQNEEDSSFTQRSKGKTTLESAERLHSMCTVVPSRLGYLGARSQKESNSKGRRVAQPGL